MSCRHNAVLISLIALSACKHLADAPTDQDEALHRYWSGIHVGSDDDLSLLASQIPAILDLAALKDAPITGRQTKLSASEQALVKLEAPPGDDGSWSLPPIDEAEPLYLIKRYPCADIDQLERILYWSDQDSLYDDYDTYERDYTSSVDDFTAGNTDTLTWQVHLTASQPLVGQEDETLRGLLRRAPLPTGDDTPWTGDHYLLTRTYIPWPATFKSPKNTFTQDYQLEIYLPIDGDIVHFYGIWRANTLAGLTLANDTLANLVKSSLLKWDDTTAKLCAAGKP